ncbi:MAG: type II secretion system minor pseudopilin GspJ [Pseudomonadota bacterium]
MSLQRKHQRGLSLPELLVALFVFALIASVGVYAVRLAVDGRAQLLETDERLRDWQLARLIVRQDLIQVAARTVRNEFGEPLAGPFIGGLGFSGRAPVSGETPLVAFVRGGWTNFGAESPRSTLQYVEYLVIEDKIIRRTRPYLDDARNQPTDERILFHDARNVELSFLLGETSRGLDWTQDWPTAGSVAAAPKAVRLTLTTKRFGDLEQLFWLGDFSRATSALGEP